ncbi:glutaredoxin family protein [Virgibacillus sp. MSP4-1]|uniref:glutaredoxin family protein n=1 Tax=Virgibacillus sp. MSP4-1 TaxID=2700081 RepID=UPI00039FB6B5|nr:glutaredoxin family protein [Virgibacillus sp. MSP4-1]QHS23234.1 glutaredoxin family protein [Virgibacillus sp. MSP4-1]
MKNNIIFYTKENCPLCEEARSLLMLLQTEYEFHIEEKDIYEDDRLLEKYQISIPVIRVDEEEIDGSQMNLQQIRKVFDKKLR